MQGTFLVTGASKGIGKSIAIQMAEEGHIVIALARQSPVLELLDNQISCLNSESFSVSCDLSSDSEISATCDKILSKVPHISGIVHNAGTIHPISNLLDAETADWNRAIRVNLLGVQNLTSSLSTILGGEMHTRITTISSGAAKRSLHGWSSYCVSKAGLDMWAMCMAEEGSKYNISAVSIAPGIVDTGMQTAIRNADESSFPSLANFIDYYENGELSNPDDVAVKLLPYCLGISGENGQRLDVRNL